jgi:branched-chain amino acid transport system ATP-binding protein
MISLPLDVSITRFPGRIRAGMLAIETLDVDIEGSRILRGVSLAVGERELVCLVGRNGAGKTTLLRTVMGYLRPARGTITFNGRRIDGVRTHTIAAAGIAFSPEESGVFGDLTVSENIELPTWTRASARPAAERIDRAWRAFPNLRRYAARGGMELSGGERKMLSIARALALDPTMLLLDEPFEGLSPAIVPAVAEGVAEIARAGQAVLIAESNIHHLPETTSRLYVIERGEIVFAGTPAEAARDASLVRIIGGNAS